MAGSRPTRLTLVEPALLYLPGYTAALERGWSPNNLHDVSAEQLAAIRADAASFIASLLSQAGTVKLPDGSEIPKLPSRIRWLWDGEFCGQIGLRWQPGYQQSGQRRHHTQRDQYHRHPRWR